MKALLIKEFRENLRWLPVALLLFGFAAWQVTPSQQNPFNAVDSDLTELIALLGSFFAAVLGVLQSAFDLRNGPRAYLHCRGVHSTDIVLAKVISGFAIYATSLFIPVSILALYLNAVGLTYYPVRPLQVLPGLLMGLAAFSFFPTAILVLARPAVWWRTRLLPLASPIAIVLICFGMLNFFTVTEAIICLGLSIFSIGLLSWAAIDAWNYLSINPSGGSTTRTRWRLAFVLTVSSAFVVSLTCLFSIVYLEAVSMKPPQWITWQNHHLDIDVKTGEPWIKSFESDYAVGPEGNHKTVGAKLVEGRTPEFTVIDKNETALRRFDWMYPIYSRETSWNGCFTEVQSQNGFILHRGYLLQYTNGDGLANARKTSDRWHLTSIVASDGVYPPGPLKGVPFDLGYTQQLLGFGTEGWMNYFVYDSKGIYRVQFSSGKMSSVSTLLQHKMDSLVHIPSRESGVIHFRFLSDGELYDYELVDESGDNQWAAKYSDEKTGQHLMDAPEVHGRFLRKVSLPSEIANSSSIYIASHDSGYAVANVQSGHTVRTQRIFNISYEGGIRGITYPIQDPIQVPLSPVAFGFAFLPPVGYIAGAVVTYWSGGNASIGEFLRGLESNGMNPSMVVGMCLAGTILSMFMIWFLFRVRAASSITRRLWLLACLPLGISAPLAVIAIYSKLIFERCPRCNVPRRIDEDQCQACRSAWEPAVREGVEIIDSVDESEEPLATAVHGD